MHAYKTHKLLHIYKHLRENDRERGRERKRRWQNYIMEDNNM